MPERLTVFEHKRISVWSYPDKGIVHHQIHDYVSGAVFHEALTNGIQAMVDCRGSKWLSDDRKNGALPPSDMEWADKVWFPQTVKAGWKHWAVLPPSVVIGQMNIQRHIKMYKDRGITVQVFTMPEEAMSWLESR